MRHLAQPSIVYVHCAERGSRHLRPAESNYDVKDRELLAIKLYLEEWRYWLEGTV